MLCARCNYDLRGHTEDQSCPECGLPVRTTMERLRNWQRSPNSSVWYMGASLSAGIACWACSAGAVYSTSVFLICLVFTALLPSVIAGLVAGRVLGRGRILVLSTIIAWPMTGCAMLFLSNAPAEREDTVVWGVLAVTMTVGSFGAAMVAARWPRR